MHPLLLKYYESELRHLRSVGAEFAEDFPKIAGRLGLEAFDCADPYVERLLEGFAFLAARVHLKLDSEYATFTQQLLDIVYPNFLAPVPSMAIAHFQPDPAGGSLAEGYLIPKGSALRGHLPKGQQTACEFRTAHEVRLYPLRIQHASYLGSRAELAHAGLQSILSGPKGSSLQAAIHIQIRCMAGARWQDLKIERLPLFFHGDGALPFRLYEQISAHLEKVIAVGRDAHGHIEKTITLTAHPMGFEEGETLLPASGRSFEGYRLLQEYFAMPERFLFSEIQGLEATQAWGEQETIDLYFLTHRVDQGLINAVRDENVALFCSPVINLFPKRTDRIQIDPTRRELHVVVDRSRPLDFEIHSILEAETVGLQPDGRRPLLPLFGSSHQHGHASVSYYTSQRNKRLHSSNQNRRGPRSSYTGSELYLSLVSASGAPCPEGVDQISLHVLTTNRDLPFLMPVGVGQTDLTLVEGGPITAIRCLIGPTRPKPSAAEDHTAWRLISHLALNYLSLVDQDKERGAVALRELLSLYAGPQDQDIHKRISGLLHVESTRVVRRIPGVGPIVFGRGKTVTLKFDEAAYEGTGAFLLGAVLERFLARYAAINSFTETRMETTERGEIMRWPARTGTRQTL